MTTTIISFRAFVSIIVAVAGLIVLLLLITTTSSTSPPISPSIPWSRSSAFRIYTAYAANIAITGPSTRYLTNIPHEVLNLDLSAYPFPPV